MSPLAEEKTKAFDIRVLGSITSGILLLPDFSKVHEAIEWLAGYPAWTHELPAVSKLIAPSLLKKFPDLPARDDIADWESCARVLQAAYPADVEIERGSGQRKRHPISTLESAITDGIESAVP